MLTVRQNAAGAGVGAAVEDAIRNISGPAAPRGGAGIAESSDPPENVLLLPWAGVCGLRMLFPPTARVFDGVQKRGR